MHLLYCILTVYKIRVYGSRITVFFLGNSTIYASILLFIYSGGIVVQEVEDLFNNRKVVDEGWKPDHRHIWARPQIYMTSACPTDYPFASALLDVSAWVLSTSVCSSDYSFASAPLDCLPEYWTAFLCNEPLVSNGLFFLLTPESESCVWVMYIITPAISVFLKKVETPRENTFN